jgi:hypothetical protein
MLFPVGHYLGAFYPGAGAPLSHHCVRIGPDVYRLDSEEEVAVWALAHGLTSQLGGQAPWTRGSVAAVSPLGAGETAAVVDKLLAREVLVEVAPGTAEAFDFATDVRLRALLRGTGNSLQYPTQYGIGHVAEPLVLVPSELLELWTWGPAFDDLWSACTLFANANRESSDAATRPTAPDEVLATLMRQMHLLLAAGAAYLDEAADPR